MSSLMAEIAYDEQMYIKYCGIFGEDVQYYWDEDQGMRHIDIYGEHGKEIKRRYERLWQTKMNH